MGKLIIEDTNGDDQEDMASMHSLVEALVPTGKNGCSTEADSPHEWQEVQINRILQACREVNPEAPESTIAPFSSKDPGFEPPWDDTDGTPPAGKWLKCFGMHS